jgi:hypothetical protein
MKDTQATKQQARSSHRQRKSHRKKEDKAQNPSQQAAIKITEIVVANQQRSDPASITSALLAGYRVGRVEVRHQSTPSDHCNRQLKNIHRRSYC